MKLITTREETVSETMSIVNDVLQAVPDATVDISSLFVGDQWAGADVLVFETEEEEVAYKELEKLAFITAAESGEIFLSM